MQENLRINLQLKRELLFHGSVYPKEISQQCSLTTRTEAVTLPEGPLEGLPSLSLNH